MEPTENTGSVADTTVAEPPPLEETGPVYITTLEELVNTRGAIIQKESVDKYSLLSVFQPSPSSLKTRLVIWASLGFPNDWSVFTAKIDPPSVCSDGETRVFHLYLRYLLDHSDDIYLTNLNTQVPGVRFSFFTGELNTIGLSVIKP